MRARLRYTAKVLLSPLDFSYRLALDRYPTFLPYPLTVPILKKRYMKYNVDTSHDEYNCPVLEALRFDLQHNLDPCLGI